MTNQRSFIKVLTTMLCLLLLTCSAAWPVTGQKEQTPGQQVGIPDGYIVVEGDILMTCVSVANQTAMLNAMAVLENVAGVDFQPCNNNQCAGNFVHVQANPRFNNSMVGMQGGQQIINIVSLALRGSELQRRQRRPKWLVPAALS